ncbi:hypothetical protein BDF19DRAFT_425187 [Syncephalis fuscata]|nr:hypothetical protein BDF19DRAFT_425187 [Syncephalis fuscata]
MKLIAALIAFNALAAVQFVSADCSPEVFDQCMVDRKDYIERCENEPKCLCQRNKDVVLCYNGCTNATMIGQKKVQEGVVSALCANLPKETVTASKNTSTPTASSTTTPSQEGSNVGVSSMNGNLVANGLLTGIAAVIGAVFYLA